MEHNEIRKELELKALNYIESAGYDRDKCVVWENYGAVETKSADTATCTVGELIGIKGYLSTFGNVDRENDVVAPGAFDETLKLQKIYPLQRNHMYGTENQMGTFKAKADENGLAIDGQILVTPANVHEAMMVKSGQLNTLSMNGIFKYAAEKNKQGRNVIERVLLFEGSLVPIPANPKATFAMKSLGKRAEVPQGNTQTPEVPETTESKLKKINKLLIGRT